MLKKQKNKQKHKYKMIDYTITLFLSFLTWCVYVCKIYLKI